jgi:hypothetical protein
MQITMEMKKDIAQGLKSRWRTDVLLWNVWPSKDTGPNSLLPGCLVSRRECRTLPAP